MRGNYHSPPYLLQTLPLPDDGTVRASRHPAPRRGSMARPCRPGERHRRRDRVRTTASGVTPVPITAVPEGLADAVRRQAVAAYRITGDAAGPGLATPHARAGDRSDGRHQHGRPDDGRQCGRRLSRPGDLQHPQLHAAIPRIGAAAGQPDLVGVRLRSARAPGDGPPPGPDGHPLAAAENLRPATSRPRSC